MGEQTSKMKMAAAKNVSVQITVAATLQRPMELKAGQVGGASWEVHKVGAKVQLER